MYKRLYRILIQGKNAGELGGARVPELLTREARNTLGAWGVYRQVFEVLPVLDVESGAGGAGLVVGLEQQQPQRLNVQTGRIVARENLGEFGNHGRTGIVGVVYIAQLVP